MCHPSLPSCSKTPGCCTCRPTPGHGSRSRWRTRTTEPQSCGAILHAGYGHSRVPAPSHTFLPLYSLPNILHNHHLLVPVPRCVTWAVCMCAHVPMPCVTRGTRQCKHAIVPSPAPRVLLMCVPCSPHRWDSVSWSSARLPAGEPH